MAAAGVAGMARVLRAIVLDFDGNWLQYREAGMDFVNNGHQAGSVLRKGLTNTLA